jgi:hypothetical protein
MSANFNLIAEASKMPTNQKLTKLNRQPDKAAAVKEIV